MTKQEFIDRLRAALNSSLAPSTVAEHVKYYEEYICSEMQKGKSEETVLNSLGDPRLIARTIIQTNTTEDGSNQESNYQSNYQAEHQKGYSAGGFQQTERRENGQVVKRFNMPGWAWILVVIVVLVLILSVIVSVLSFLAPILVPVVVIAFLVKLFRDWLN
ncbi:MAG: DUF1700 domain-containing protein [Lachnospiraceae bacterium]|nr:DUF1700 domain-containing protein [Lachnospiraceae bacterium]